MALTKDTASKIIDIVAADVNSRIAIQPTPILEILIPRVVLEFKHTSGSVQNLIMIAQGKYTGDREFDQKICLGITYVTFKAIFAAIKQGKLPDVKTTGNAHRKHWGIEHEATAIDMIDGTAYVFDWHATLKVYDPVISKYEDWLQAKNATNYILFSGFK